jgi:hypothetical protein
MTQDCSKLKLISAFFFFPMRSFLGRLGIRYDFSGITNTYYRKSFDSIPPAEKAVILPHCLIGNKCKGHFSKEDGIICVKCKNCRCCDIRTISEEQGWQFYITPSTGFTKRLVQRKNIRAAVGAACNLEIERGIRSTTISTRGVHLKRGKVIPQIVLTSNYDCLHNDIDWQLLQRIIRGEMAGV